MNIENKTSRNTFFGISADQMPLSGTTFRYRFTKYAFYLLSGFTIVSCGTFIMFTYQNYEMFLKITYDFAPDVLNYLQRERAWLTTVTISFALASLVFVTLFVYRVASQVTGPVDKLHRRFKELSHGMFYLGPLRIRDNDEFRELIDSYNYFQEALKIQTTQEIHDLRALAEKARSKEMVEEIYRIISYKQKQVNDLSLPSDPSRDSRHAS
jgi:methyl-accepting chemotaxis protein